MSGERVTMYPDVHERYKKDPAFRQVVDLMTQFIIREKYTPGEMRDAAFMASLNFEQIYRVTEHRYVFPEGPQ